MMNQTLGAVLCIVIGALTTAFAFAQTKTDPLAASFLNPPPSAQPQVWWHWVNGNVSKAGITADLEGWKRVGIGGGTICNLGDFADPGPAHFNSDVWWDDTKFAMSEAARLGLELGVENCEGWSSSGGPWIKPEDAMKMLVWSETRVKGVDSSPVHVVQPLTRNDFYRDVAVLAFPSPPAGPGSAGSNALHASDVVNLTSKLRSDGTIAWTPPAGAWTILRIGYTNTGAVNHPASKYGIGLECDKLSKVALEHHFAGFFDHVAATCATIPGNPLKWSLIDSYEVGAQNWTDDLPAQFKNRNGYDITPWLITLAGRDLESADQTHRFNFDFTRTISEMWDSNYWGYFADLLHKLGLKGQVEPYGNGAFDTLRSSGLVDMPMSEFWYPGQGVVSLGKQVARWCRVLYGRRPIF